MMEARRATASEGALVQHRAHAFFEKLDMAFACTDGVGLCLGVFCTGAAVGPVGVGECTAGVWCGAMCQPAGGDMVAAQHAGVGFSAVVDGAGSR
mgnify:CR=1 FL=1